MASQLQLRRGTTAQHVPFIGAPAEVTVDTNKKTLVVHDGTTAGGFPVLSASGGTMTGPVSMGGSKITNLATPTAFADAASKGYVDGLIVAATLADADYGDITVSSGATVWTIDNGAVTEAKLASGAVTSGKIANGTIVDANIANDTITNAKIKSDAAIAGTKIVPNFGSQNVVTTGTLSCRAATFITGSPDRIGTDFTSNAISTLNFGSPNSGEGNFQLQYNRSAGTFAILGGNTGSQTERMRIDASGNVGIGTSSPSSRLTVDTGSGQFTQAICVNPSTHSTSRRSGITLDEWLILQDALGNGTKNFALYQAGTANVVRLIVDTSGNVGIGTSSPAARLAVFTNSATDTVASIGNTAGNGWMGYVTSTGDMLYGLFTSGAITFRTSNITRVLIDNNGNLFAGYLSGGTATTGGIIKAKGYNTKAGAGSGLGSNVFNINWSSPSASLHIDDTNLGNIQLSSDHRIKRNVETQTDAAIDRIKQIRPVKYQYAAYGEIFQNEETVREGFIAHELAEVVPSAVDGEKDAPNQLQSLRLDALCAVLVKAVQELSAKVEALEAAQQP